MAILIAVGIMAAAGSIKVACLILLLAFLSGSVISD